MIWFQMTWMSQMKPRMSSDIQEIGAQRGEIAEAAGRSCAPRSTRATGKWGARTGVGLPSEHPEALHTTNTWVSREGTG